MLRLVILLTALSISDLLYGQQIDGLVVDQVSGSPIINAVIQTSNSITFTDSKGGFNLGGLDIGDTIRISHMSYLLYDHIFDDTSKTSLLVIKLKARSIVLKPVNINATRNYTLDSLARRKEFASVFAYQDLRFKDIFVEKSPTINHQYQPFQPSTSSIVSVDLLSVIGLLGKNKNPVSKLQKKLLQEEKDNYIAHIFSEEKVRSLTPLRGDSLQKFINKYRPSADLVAQMSDYEMLLYIKKSYEEFIRNEKNSILENK